MGGESSVPHCNPVVAGRADGLSPIGARSSAVPRRFGPGSQLIHQTERNRTKKQPCAMANHLCPIADMSELMACCCLAPGHQPYLNRCGTWSQLVNLTQTASNFIQ